MESPTKSQKVVITIPAFNEAKNIGGVLADIYKVMKETSYKYEVVVVNDASKDATADIARKYGASVISHERNLGLAEVFRTEMKECLDRKADIIVHIDADGQYLAKDIPRLLSKLNEGYDLVLGSRFKGKIEYMPWLKRMGNRAFTRVISRMAGMYISDGQTGFRAFTSEVADKISINSTYTYTQEQIIRAARERFKIAEIPIFFAKRGKTKSRLMKGPFDYAKRAGINLIRTYRDYEPLNFFGGIGLTFLFIAGLIAIYLIYEAFQLKLPDHTALIILDFLFILVGIQIILFGFLADIFRK